jgi:hypothetical protein
MYKKQITTALAILAIATAISLVTSSNSAGLVNHVFAVKNTDKHDSTSSGGSSTSKKGTTSTDGSTATTTSSSQTSSEKKFIKCVEAISGKITKADIDDCYDQVFTSSDKTLSSSSTTGRNSGGSSPQFGGLSLGSSK